MRISRVSKRVRGIAGTLVVGGALLLGHPAATLAQPNSGNITFTGSVDVPSVYVFRGFIQESDPKLSVAPEGRLGIKLGPSVITIGTWHSLLTGSSGLDGPTGRLHYEERFYSGLALPVGGGVTLETTWTAYTSPNLLFETRQELSLRVGSRNWLGPYALAAVELEGHADRFDDGAGSYLELGAEPRLGLGFRRGRLSVPTKVGLSLNNYYQGFSRDDSRFGFFAVGGHVTLTMGDGNFGAWQLRGGTDVYLLGDTPRVRNNGDRLKIVGFVGLGVQY